MRIYTKTIEIVDIFEILENDIV